MAWRKSIMLTAKACALTAPLAFVSCAEDSVSLRVECSILPQSEEGGCIFDPGGDCLLEGRLNIQSATYYHGAVRVTSSLKPRENDIPVQAETNGVTITEFEITVLNPSGGSIAFGDNLPNPYRIATSGFIPVGQSGIASGDFLPTPYVARLRANEATDAKLGQVILDVIVRGRTQGDVEVEAGSWRWPIRLFDLDVKPGSTTCTVFDSAVCNLGQDEFVNACENQNVAEP
jgi:hypothetical protein